MVNAGAATVGWPRASWPDGALWAAPFANSLPPGSLTELLLSRTLM